MNWRHSSLVAERPEIEEFIDFVLANDVNSVGRLLSKFPGLARDELKHGATRQVAQDYFVDELFHYVYGGDTALHIAAMAYCPGAIEVLSGNGADISARNRRGAQPLHYAADGGPYIANWNPKRQEATVRTLIELGADPNTLDKGGVAPIHRAVRQRCTGAVRALIAGGACIDLPNKQGTTPLRLAQLTTGRGGSGTAEAKREQAIIIELLIDAGARPQST